MKKIIGIYILFLFILIILIPLTTGYEDKYESINKVESVLNYDLPDYFSWKDYEGYDWTTPARNQRNCGSCYIFAAVGAIESCIKISENDPYMNIDLSEQYVLSCLPGATNNSGCDGGSAGRVFEYILSNSSDGNYYNGIIPESCMPYQANDTIPCEDKCEDWVNQLVPIYKWDMVTRGGMNRIPDIKNKIIKIGPIAVKFMATSHFSSWFKNNHNPNDYYPDSESVEGYNHGVVMLGWKDDSSIENGGYWICKNSWGSFGGYDGFFNIEYNALNIGFSHMYYVSVAKPDLNTIDTITLNDLTPGETVSFNFTIENNGKYGSLLDWNITEWPDWGEWTIRPKYGISLTPYDEPIVVKVSVKIPDLEEKDYKGNIKIINKDDEEDFESIEITLTTSKIKNKISDNAQNNRLYERLNFIQSYFSNYFL